jgi:hypothetical protein
MSADGGQAFPIQAQQLPNGEVLWPEPGMTLRDYFAGKAMHAELTTSGVPGEACNALVAAAATAGRDVADQLALNAYEIADAMLKARSA